MALNDFLYEDAAAKYYEGQDGIAYPVPKEPIAPIPAAVPTPDNGKGWGVPAATPAYTTQPPLAPSSVTPAGEPGEFVPAAAQVAGPSPMGGMPQQVQTTLTTPQSTQEQSQKVIPKEYQQQIKAAAEAQKQAIIAQAEVEQAQATEIARLQGEQQGAMTASYERQQKVLQEKQDAYNAGVTQYQQAVEKYSNTKLTDPKEEKSFVSRIASALAVGLGAYASAKTGTPNYALQIVNDSIDRNINRQKFEIEKLGSTAAAKRNDLARLGQELGNYDLAEKALRQTMLEKVKSQVEVMASKSASDTIKNRASAMIADIDKQTAATLGEANAITQRIASNSGGASVTSMPTNKTNPLQTRFGQAYSETAANKVRETDAASITGKEGIAAFKQTLAELGLGRFKPGAKAGKMQAATDSMKDTIRQLNNMGVLQPSEAKELQDKLAGLKLESQLQAYADEVDNRIDRNMKAIVTSHVLPGQSPEGRTQAVKNQFGFQGK